MGDDERVTETRCCGRQTGVHVDGPSVQAGVDDVLVDVIVGQTRRADCFIDAIVG